VNSTNVSQVGDDDDATFRAEAVTTVSTFIILTAPLRSTYDVQKYHATNGAGSTYHRRHHHLFQSINQSISLFTDDLLAIKGHRPLTYHIILTYSNR